MALISVIVPAFEEENNIVPTAESIAGALDGTGLDLELIFVDDGSRDHTWDRIRERSAADPRVRGIRFSRNMCRNSGMVSCCGKALPRKPVNRRNVHRSIQDLRCWSCGKANIIRCAGCLLLPEMKSNRSCVCRSECCNCRRICLPEHIYIYSTKMLNLR